MQIRKPTVATSRLLAHHTLLRSIPMTHIQNDAGIAMILSPAKTLDLTPLSDRKFAADGVNADVIEKLSDEYTMSLCDASKTDAVLAAMKEKSESELKSLLKLSPALAKSSHEYWSTFDMKTRASSPHLGVFTFSGPAFQQGIIPQNCNVSTLRYLAKNLYILDSVYGVLRAVDKMQPYRLEMGCKGVVDVEGSEKKESLATYWKESITAHLGNQLSISSDDGGPILANLASEEYSSSVDIASLPANTIFVNIIFRHKGRVIAVHAKRARGLMVRYIAEQDAKSLSDISNFDLEGYRCISAGEKKWETVDLVGDNVQVVTMTFDRDDVPAAATSKSKRKDDGDVPKNTSRKKRQ